MEIPFIFGKIATGENFTDREEETRRLINNFNNCINTILISPRRWGKSSLVYKAASLACVENKKLKVCYIDLFNILNVEEFYTAYATAVIKATSSKWEEFIKNAGDFLSSLRPKFTFGSHVGEEVSLSLDVEQLHSNPDEILNLPEKIAEKKRIRICVCIDEFQKIADWKDADFLQGKFRSIWQHHQKVGYCLYGSKRHMMMEIFTDTSKPFYRFGDLIFLKKIERQRLIEFIRERFNDSDKAIDDDAALLITRMINDHPYYCQQLAQLSWLRTADRCDCEIVRKAHSSLIEQLSLVFTNLTEELTNQQLNYLKALLAGESAISSAAVMHKYGITSATSAMRSKQTLIKKEVLDNTEGFVQFLDPVYEYWLTHTFFRLPGKIET